LTLPKRKQLSSKVTTRDRKRKFVGRVRRSLIVKRGRESLKRDSRRLRRTRLS
jgi:hypothetical protein